MISEREIIDRLREGTVALPPLALTMVENAPPPVNGGTLRADALVDITWQDQRVRFAVECRAYTSPKIVQETAARAVETAAAMGLMPLVITPWLPPEQLQILERRNVSGIDLNGNGIVTVPGRWLIFRTGQKNAFPRTIPIRRAYQGGSSLVPRTFLLRPEFGSVNDVFGEIRNRAGNLSLSSVSRVLQQLEQDLVVSRNAGGLRVVDADTLIDRLIASYRPPTIKQRFLGKCPPRVGPILQQAAQTIGARLTLTGAGSVDRYAVFGREPVDRYYCTVRPDRLLAAANLRAEETSRFPTIELLQTDDPTVYFDSRMETGEPVASPIQALLELSVGDKRQQDAAKQVRTGILQRLAAPATRKEIA